MIHNAVDNRDEEVLRFIAHKLKSMAGNLQAHSLESLSRGVEKRLKANDPGGVDLAEELAAELTEVLSAISERLQAMS